MAELQSEYPDTLSHTPCIIQIPKAASFWKYHNMAKKENSQFELVFFIFETLLYIRITSLCLWMESESQQFQNLYILHRTRMPWCWLMLFTLCVIYRWLYTSISKQKIHEFIIFKTVLKEFFSKDYIFDIWWTDMKILIRIFPEY